ncbi:nucleotidyltransferase domain-containing protein [Nocardioides ferulae]|uniref:nucleotidyltransferase domain-containing protein n=1 Tax=Nocardioides ferulae TaxID=2340821 RepID=UPI000EB2890E|nr:nucleotidyltransferase domain-containing protein [Nocardioides ferulae]
MTTRRPVPSAVTALGARLAELGWVRDLWVAGSLATGDHLPGVSDLDLVAVVDGRVDTARIRAVAELHRDLDSGPALGAALGCAYVEEHRLLDVELRHPTWTHGRLVERPLSQITRAELVRHGFAVFGRPPVALLPPVTGDDVRRAARAELAGYWSWAVRRPWVWLDPTLAELGLTAMARGRHAIATGELMTKSRAVEQAAAPPWLADLIRARRRGEPRPLPRLRGAWIAWRDASRTVRGATAGSPTRRSFLDTRRRGGNA